MSFNKLTKQLNLSICLSILILGSIVLSGCKKSVKVTEGPDAPSYLSPEVAKPIVTTPEEKTYYSNDTELVISGLCEDKHVVHINGDASDKQNCINKTFSFNLTKDTDGIYNFFLTQSYDGTSSEPTTLTWQRKTTVPPPDITYPPSSIYKSSETVLNITGNCETGSTITLSGDGVGTDICASSSFSIAIPKFSDGDYNFTLTQKDLANNEASSNFLWEKRVLEVTPDNPTIVATQEQVFSPSGGSSSYTLVLQENNSGATFDPNTNTYTAGTTAGVMDKIILTDSLGASLEINITVAADLPDHFILPVDSGADQSQTIGLDFLDVLKVQVVDQYGNGVPAYPVVFTQKVGSLLFLDSNQQSTDANGFASITVQQGFHSTKSTVTVTPAGSPLPDNAGTGQAIISLSLIGTTNNNGNFDLNFSLGNSPENIVMGDFNEDSILDIALLNKGDPSIGILLGQNGAFFNSQSKINSICTTPYALITGDYNEDTHLDLFISCNNKYSLFTGVGDGTFNAAVDINLDVSENLPVALASGDLNGDNHLDILSVSVGANLIAIRYGVGDGTFSAPTFLPTGAGTSPSKVEVGDLDKINGLDIVVINSALDNVGVFLNNGAGSFLAQANYFTGVAPSDLMIADFDNDTYLDIATANNVDNNVSVFINDQAGGMNLPINTLVGQGPTALFAKDYNNDNNPDLFVTNSIDNSLSVLQGLGNGTFNILAPILVGSNPLDVIVNETNDDAFQDIVVVSNGDKKVQVIPTQAGGIIGYKNIVGNGPRDITTADFNGDGHIDQAVVNNGDNNIQILIGNGLGLFANFNTLLTSSGPVAIKSADIDDDDDIDLVVVNQNVNNIQVYLNTGSGSFDTPTIYGVASQPSALTFEDFNKDGNLDLVVANSGANSLSFFPGVGDGTFSTRSDTNTSAQPSSLATGDMNQDGIVDLIVTHQSANSVGVYLGNGDGTFTGPANYSTQTGPNGVVVGYFNSDLNIDVAVSNSLSASVSVYFGNSDGSLGLPVNYSCGADPTSIRKADLNGDNNEDLIVGNGLNQKATALLGSFFGDFSNSKIIPSNINTVGVELTDVNHDGTIDLLFIDGTNNEIKLMLGL
ncbi:MAG: VCBS repeat-containing protein [Bdellovibrionales bacterium]|nr:VCBS repeat-containing protein [Bdellovibrionales bacterium]